MNYYNEFDKFAAEWLRSLIASNLIPKGHVDTRSITDVSATDLAGYTQCHFFAGIGGWPLALQLAGWDSTRPVWTGSCPCQPFSSAGKGEGQEDERHLWPILHGLIAECRPDVVFGEQVAAAVGFGWLDGVSADLEGEGYACGAAVLGAHSVGAPHIRQRLYWVADADGRRNRSAVSRADQRPISQGNGSGNASRGLADASGYRLDGPARQNGQSDGRGESQGGTDAAGSLKDGACRLANDNVQRCDRQQICLQQRRPLQASHEITRSCRSGWGNTWVPCADGKARRVKPGLPLLAHGVPNRVGRLRGYGNAIVPQVAAEFIAAFIDVKQ